MSPHHVGEWAGNDTWRSLPALWQVAVWGILVSGNEIITLWHKSVFGVTYPYARNL